jgi:hypothetical protein
MTALVAVLLMLAVFVGPLALRIVIDRRADRAAGIAADLRAAVRARLGGDSMVSVEVRAGGPWSRGRVMLFAPTGYERLIQKVWPVVAARVPPGYELVVRAWGRRPHPAVPSAPVARAA